MADSESDLPPLAERRPARRSRVLLGGVLVYDKGRHSFRCTIRDLSPSGARISISKGQLLPRDVYLIDIRARTAQQAELIWVGEMAAGLKYLRAIDLDKPLEPEFAYLKRILDAHSTR